MKVELADPEPNGLAHMLAGLIEANLARHPARADLLKRAAIDITVPDADVSVTVLISPQRVAIRNGDSDGTSHVHVRAASHDLLLLSSVPLRLGLPDPFTQAGRLVIRKVLRREIRIDGLIAHPGKLARLSKLLSVV